MGKMNHNDAVFVHAEVSQVFTDSGYGLAFPVDEWSCYLQQAFSHDEHVRIAFSYLREWILVPNVWDTIDLVWGNISQVSTAPFSFDLLAPRTLLNTVSSSGNSL